MSLDLTSRIRTALTSELQRLGVEPPVEITLEVPPKPEFGDLACPVAFELARRLKKTPRDIAAGLKGVLDAVDGVDRAEVAGGGYLNIFFDRDRFLRAVGEDLGRAPSTLSGVGKRIVEHTNINPNKAAHIGHLRNAVLGDTLVRCLRYLGHTVEVQNYIDDTGVQVADLAVGFVEIRGLTLEEVRRISEQCGLGQDWRADTRHFFPPSEMRTVSSEVFAGSYAFDAYCWDLYAEVAPYYASSPERARKRGEALKQMEARSGTFAEIAAFVSAQMVLHHLRTMRWIGVGYDLLARESDILHLGFWAKAFERLQSSGAIRYATEGKARGCWVMDLPDAAEAEDEGAKIIVRSDGTVTYVGKDIAYQMWKFGLLGQDFFYELILPALPPNRTDVMFTPVSGTPRSLWTTCSSPAQPDHPRFGGASRVYNVIDVRQSYLQKVVAQGLLALGFDQQARDSVHFSYEMVALTPRSVERLSGLGLIPDANLTDEDRARPYIEMSGRRGIGVKAEDLLTSLVNTAADQVGARNPESAPADAATISVQIAIGALRYYMLRFTKNRVVAFDLEDSLAFEGETGPYLQYAAVRSRNIFNKLSEREGRGRDAARLALAECRFAALDEADAVEHWQIVREIARFPEIVQQAVDSLEMSVLARFAFSVSQRFSTFYHRYPILHEPDPAKKTLRIALNEVYLSFMELSLGLMGVPVPERM